MRTKLFFLLALVTISCSKNDESAKTESVDIMDYIAKDCPEGFMVSPLGKTMDIIHLRISEDSLKFIETYIRKLIAYEAEVIVVNTYLKNSIFSEEFDSIFHSRPDIILLDSLLEDGSTISNYDRWGSGFFGIGMDVTDSAGTSFVTSFPMSLHAQNRTMQHIGLVTLRAFNFRLYRKLMYEKAEFDRLSILFHGGDCYQFHSINGSEIDKLVRDRIVIISVNEEEKKYYTPFGIYHQTCQLSEATMGQPFDYSEYEKMSSSTILANIIATLINYGLCDYK